MSIINDTVKLIGDIFNSMGFLYKFENKRDKVELMIGFDCIFVKIKAGIEINDAFTKVYFELNGIEYKKWISTGPILGMVKVLLLFIKALMFNDTEARDQLNSFALTEEEIKQLLDAKYKARLDFVNGKVAKLSKRIHKYKKVKRKDEKEKAKLKHKLGVYKVRLMKI